MSEAGHRDGLDVAFAVVPAARVVAEELDELGARLDQRRRVAAQGAERLVARNQPQVAVEERESEVERVQPSAQELFGVPGSMLDCGCHAWLPGQTQRPIMRRNENGRQWRPFRDGEARCACQTRRRYSPVRVSISMRSPVVTKSGTWTSKPLASLAGFMTLPDVSPLTAGSV